MTMTRTPIAGRGAMHPRDFSSPDTLRAHDAACGTEDALATISWGLGLHLGRAVSQGY